MDGRGWVANEKLETSIMMNGLEHRGLFASFLTRVSYCHCCWQHSSPLTFSCST